MRYLRCARTYVQTINAVPEKVFPLLCPVMEEKWVPGWGYKMIYSESGVAEKGCVFLTEKSSGNTKQETWMVTEYDAHNGLISFARTDNQDLICSIQIQLRLDDDKSKASVSYSYTALSEDGNKFIEDEFSESQFNKHMQGWEKAMNYYLETGQCIEE